MARSSRPSRNSSPNSPLAVARANVAGLGRPGARVRLAEGDWFSALPDELRGTVDVVVSNPPYVASDAELPAEVAAWEPTAALLSGADGLDDIRRIAEEAVAVLRGGAWLLLEHGFDQAEGVRGVLRARGYAEVASWTDLGGRWRVTGGRAAAC